MTTVGYCSSVCLRVVDPPPVWVTRRRLVTPEVSTLCVHFLRPGSPDVSDTKVYILSRPFPSINPSLHLTSDGPDPHPNPYRFLPSLPRLTPPTGVWPNPTVEVVPSMVFSDSTYEPSPLKLLCILYGFILQ